MHSCPTVKIVSEDPEHGGFIVINKADFDAELHTKFDEPPPPPPAMLPPVPRANPLLAKLGANWETRSDLRKIAEAHTGRAVQNNKEAVEVLKAALAAK